MGGFKRIRLGWREGRALGGFRWSQLNSGRWDINLTHSWCFQPSWCSSQAGLLLRKRIGSGSLVHKHNRDKLDFWKDSCNLNMSGCCHFSFHKFRTQKEFLGVDNLEHKLWRTILSHARGVSRYSEWRRGYIVTLASLHWNFNWILGIWNFWTNAS